jgi:hypothetical protein
MGQKLLHLSQKYGKVTVSSCMQRAVSGNIVLSPTLEKRPMHKKLL